jgi:Tfp pilus assembly protein PilN
MKAVNLIPADQHSRASVPTGRSGGGAYVVLGLLAGLALMALLYGTAAHQISNNRKLYASLTARTAQAQARAAALTSYTNFMALREQRVQAVTQLVDSRFDWANSFYELGRVLPAGASIGSLEGEVGAVSGTGASSSSSSASSSTGASTSVTSATPPGSIPSFVLVGCATSQSEVATTLERLRLIDGVDEVQLQSATKTGAGGGGGGGSCTGNDVSFGVHVSFDALPAVPSVSSTAHATVAATNSTAATASASTAPPSSSTASTSSSASAATPSKAPASTGTQEPAQ